MRISVRITAFAGMLVLSAGFWSCALGQTTGGTSLWTELRLPEHDFSVMFPGTPSPKDVPSDPGLRSYEFITKSSNDVYFIVISYYQPGTTPTTSEIYRATIDACAKRSQSAVLWRNPITLAGHEGAEALLDKQDHSISFLIDLVMIGNRLYLIASSGPKGHENSSDAARFRDSFHLLSR